jgi:phosphotriesterase-related protein
VRACKVARRRELECNVTADAQGATIMNRRDFLRVAAASAGSLRAAQVAVGQGPMPSDAMVQSVTGLVSVSELGAILPHEHVLVDFVGADQVSRQRYDAAEVFDAVLPHLKRLREVGGRTLVECTPAYLGRDPRLLQQLARASGVTLMTNTGYYGARQGKFLPLHAFDETADQLAQRWIAEWREGIEGTGIRPGLIKIGVDAGPMSAVNRKLVQAAARTHRATGLTIASHTGDGQAALEQLEVLRVERVPASAWIWVHAQNEPDRALHRRAARQGAWVEFDGVGPDSIEQHVELVRALQNEHLLDRVLVSHDAGWYSVGQTRGGPFRPYDTLFTRFLPALKQAGVTDDDVRQLTVVNPARALLGGT